MTADGGARGLRRGLTHYGDSGFAWFLRRSFAASMGLSDDALDRPVVGIANAMAAGRAAPTAALINPLPDAVPRAA